PGLPGIVGVLPGLAAGFARCRNGVLQPDPLAGGGIERSDPVAHPRAAIGSADDDLILDGEGRRRDDHARYFGERGLPRDLAGLLIGGDDTPWTVGGRNDEIAPQGGAAVLALLLLFRVHAPDDVACVSRGAVDLVEHAPGIRDVEKAVFGERRRFVEFVAGAAAEWNRVGKLEALDGVPVNPGERRKPLAVIGAVVHQPVAWLRDGEALGRDICRNG